MTVGGNFGAGMAILFSFLVFAYTKVDLESLGRSIIAYLYPSAFLLVLSGVTSRAEISRFPYRPRLVLENVGEIIKDIE